MSFKAQKSKNKSQLIITVKNFVKKNPIAIAYSDLFILTIRIVV